MSDHAIEFEHVWFAYKEENWVLQDISFKLKKSKTLAVVGLTGAGKSTLVNLILRFYDIQKGIIKINGIDIKEYSLHDLRSLFSIVLQDPVIFSATIAENISLKQPHISPEIIQQAMQYVELSRFVNALPLREQYVLHERGSGLSAGQMQLISLARAVANQREILILDEATANIDFTTEQLIQNATAKIMRRQTTLIIAHRLKTVQHADQIIVLHHGKIVESGNHQQLMATKGIYEKLFRLQFQSV